MKGFESGDASKEGPEKIHEPDATSKAPKDFTRPGEQGIERKPVTQHGNNDGSQGPENTGDIGARGFSGSDLLPMPLQAIGGQEREQYPDYSSLAYKMAAKAHRRLFGSKVETSQTEDQPHPEKEKLGTIQEDPREFSLKEMPWADVTKHELEQVINREEEVNKIYINIWREDLKNEHSGRKKLQREEHAKEIKDLLEGYATRIKSFESEYARNQNRYSNNERMLKNLLDDFESGKESIDASFAENLKNMQAKHWQEDTDLGKTLGEETRKLEADIITFFGESFSSPGGIDNSAGERRSFSAAAGSSREVVTPRQELERARIVTEARNKLRELRDVHKAEEPPDVPPPSDMALPPDVRRNALSTRHSSETMKLMEKHAEERAQVPLFDSEDAKEQYMRDLTQRQNEQLKKLNEQHELERSKLEVELWLP